MFYNLRNILDDTVKLTECQKCDYYVHTFQPNYVGGHGCMLTKHTLICVAAINRIIVKPNVA